MSSSKKSEPRAIIIGSGVAGIAASARLKTQLGSHNIEVFEREKPVGGTWYLNTYPGVGCDVDSYLYLFSFNLNPDWSKRFAEQGEILSYLNDTVNKFRIRPHVTMGVEVTGAAWNEKKWVWEVELRTFETGHKFVREAEIMVLCVGAISIPADVKILNHENFNSTIWHSARWNHNYDLSGKTVAIIRNGCSAAQLVPHVVKEAGKVYQFQRSAQWVNSRINSDFSSLQEFCFRYVPLCNKIYRFWLRKMTDGLHTLYQSEPESASHRSCKRLYDAHGPHQIS